MYLPKIYETFSERFPEVFKNYKQLGIVCREAGPLDEKPKTLLSLGLPLA